MTGINTQFQGTTSSLGGGSDVAGPEFTLAQASSGGHPVGQPFGQRAFGNDCLIYQQRNAAGDYEVYVHSLRLDKSALAFTSDRPVDFDKDASTRMAPGFMNIPNPFQMKPSPLKAALDRTHNALNAEADKADQARAEASGAPMSPTFAGRFAGGVAGAVRTLAQDVTSGVATQAFGPGPNGMVPMAVTPGALAGLEHGNRLALSTVAVVNNTTSEITEAVAQKFGVPLDSPEARFGAQAMQVALMIEGIFSAVGAINLVRDAGGMRLAVANSAAIAPLRAPNAQQLARTLAWVDEMTPGTYAAMPAQVKDALRQGLNANRTKPGAAAALDKLNAFADGPGTTGTRSAGGALVRTGADPAGASGGAANGGAVSTLGTRFGQPITQTPKGNGYELTLGGKPFYQSPTPIELSDLQKPGRARNALEALGPSPQTGGFSMGVDVTSEANRLLQGATGGIGLGAGTGPTNSVIIGSTFSGQPLGSGLSTQIDRPITAGGETLTSGADPTPVTGSPDAPAASPREQLLGKQRAVMDFVLERGIDTASLDPQAEGAKLTPQSAQAARKLLGEYDAARAAAAKTLPPGAPSEPEDLHANALRAALKGYDARGGTPTDGGDGQGSQQSLELRRSDTPQERTLEPPNRFHRAAEIQGPLNASLKNMQVAFVEDHEIVHPGTARLEVKNGKVIVSHTGEVPDSLLDMLRRLDSLGDKKALDELFSRSGSKETVQGAADFLVRNLTLLQSPDHDAEAGAMTYESDGVWRASPGLMIGYQGTVSLHQLALLLPDQTLQETTRVGLHHAHAFGVDFLSLGAGHSNLDVASGLAIAERMFASVEGLPPLIPNLQELNLTAIEAFTGTRTDSVYTAGTNGTVQQTQYRIGAHNEGVPISRKVRNPSPVEAKIEPGTTAQDVLAMIKSAADARDGNGPSLRELYRAVEAGEGPTTATPPLGNERQISMSAGELLKEAPAAKDYWRVLGTLDPSKDVTLDLEAGKLVIDGKQYEPDFKLNREIDDAQQAILKKGITPASSSEDRLAYMNVLRHMLSLARLDWLIF